MTNKPNEKDKPKGNDKPGGGSQVPLRQQGKEIPGGDKNDEDIEARESKKD